MAEREVNERVYEIKRARDSRRAAFTQKYGDDKINSLIGLGEMHGARSVPLALGKRSESTPSVLRALGKVQVRDATLLFLVGCCAYSFVRLLAWSYAILGGALSGLHIFLYMSDGPF